LGALRAQHGDSNAAARVFAAAARAAPQSAPAQAGVGVALPRLNRPVEAIAYCEAALALDPRQADAAAFRAGGRHQSGTGVGVAEPQNLACPAQAPTRRHRAFHAGGGAQT